ncbi:MAG: PrsW family intramembrane metalloprotease [bacterium]|nr:PrsW family intramembrane metalloprotease [bacterium]
MDADLPRWLGIMLGFLSVGPLMLLFSVKSIKQYGGPVGRLWERLIEPRLDGVSRRFVSLAVFAGMAAGMLSIPVVVQVNEFLFENVSLAFRPSEPMAILTQIAFIQAGLIEELAKNALGLVFAFLICRAPSPSGGDAARNDRRLFLKSTPFLFAGAGLGFALLENSQYIRYYASLGPGGIFLGRSLIATSAHALLNLYFGLCLLSATRENFARTVLRALAIVVLWHGVYDFFALPPVALSQWLTMVFLCIIIYITLSKLYRELPELRYRPLRPALEVAAEQAELSGLPPLESNQMRDENPMSVGAFESANETKAEDSSGRQPTAAEWHERLAVLPAVPDRFEEFFLADPWRLRLPAGDQSMPYEFSEFAQLSSESLALIARPGTMPLSASQLPAKIAQSWADEAEWWCRVFQVERPHGRWDTTSFAQGLAGSEAGAPASGDADSANDRAAVSPRIFEDLAGAGVDLLRTVPFQVLEFRVANPPEDRSVVESADAPQTAGEANAVGGERYVYITQGLSELYERELLVSFSHPHPMVRWFFLHLASMSPDQAPWLREFHAFYSERVDGLGDPRGWLRFYVSVPMIDPIVARIAAQPEESGKGARLSVTDADRDNAVGSASRPVRAARDLPLQILMCAYPDGAYIARRGVPGYLQALRHLGYPWHNDFRRPAVDL